MSSRSSVRCTRFVSALSLVVCLGPSAGCGSPEEPGSSDPAPTASGGAASSPASSPAPSPAASPSPSPSPAPPSPTPASPSSEAPAATPEASDPAAVEGIAASQACDALGAVDACGACVCSACASELEACLGVPGCAEILVCVRESGCAGRACYCGEASLAECLRGEADGPCKDIVLAAPGGKAPTLEDGSGGPASDAALGVSDCAEEQDVCGAACGEGE
jgi:hypothetical protein